MTVNFMPLVNVLLGLAAAAVAAAVPLVVPLLRRALGVHISAAQAAVIDSAVKRGAGAAMHFLAANESGIGDVGLKNVALAEGAQYVVGHVPEALAAFGLTRDHVQEMVSAELGRLIAPRVAAKARAPTEGADAPPSASAPAPVPEGSAAPAAAGAP